MGSRVLVAALALAVALLKGAGPGGAEAVEMDPEMAELAQVLRENCAAETGVAISLVEAVNSGADLSPDPALKCYIKCVMETAGMYSDGVVDVDAVVALLPEDFRTRNEANLRACGTVAGADDCDTAYKTQQCWQNANKKDYFLI